MNNISVFLRPYILQSNKRTYIKRAYLLITFLFVINFKPVSMETDNVSIRFEGMIPPTVGT